LAPFDGPRHIPAPPPCPLSASFPLSRSPAWDLPLRSRSRSLAACEAGARASHALQEYELVGGRGVRGGQGPARAERVCVRETDGRETEGGRDGRRESARAGTCSTPRGSWGCWSSRRPCARWCDHRTHARARARARRTCARASARRPCARWRSARARAHPALLPSPRRGRAGLLPSCRAHFGAIIGCARALTRTRAVVCARGSRLGRGV
jgi:hypothetical protein